MQAVRSVRSGHRAVRPRTTRVEIAGPSHREGGTPLLSKPSKRGPSRRRASRRPMPRAFRAKLGVRFDARPRAARAHRPHSHNVATQTPPHPDASRRSADTSERGTDVCRYRTPLPHPIALAAPPRLPPPPLCNHLGQHEEPRHAGHQRRGQDGGLRHGDGSAGRRTRGSSRRWPS